METITKARNNIWKLYLISFLGGIAFFYNAIETLYYKHFGLSFQQIGLLISASMISAIILEIPTGAFADLYGKKKSLILASVSNFIAISFLAFGNTFIHFLIGFVFWGAGRAFNSGASSALLYDSLKNMGQEFEFTKHTGRLSSVFISLDILSGALGPLMFALNVRLPYFVSWVAILLVIPLQFSLYEKNNLIKHTINPIKEHLIQMLESLKIAINNKILVWLTIFSLLFFVINKVFSEMISAPYYINIGYTLQNLSIIGVIGSLIQTAFVFLADKFERKLRNFKSFLLMITLVPIVLISLMISRSLIITAIFSGFYYSLISFGEVIIESYLNRNISDNNRATVLSISSMTVSLSALISLPLIGEFIDNYTLIGGFWLVSILVLVIGSLLLVRRPSFDKNE
jgi:MFS family permease